MLFARVVPSKGVQSYAVKSLASDIALLGHPEIILKSDGEPAIVALKEVAKVESSESSSNRLLLLNPSPMVLQRMLCSRFKVRYVL